LRLQAFGMLNILRAKELKIVGAVKYLSITYAHKRPPDAAVIISSIILVSVVCWFIILFSLKQLMPGSSAFLESLLSPTFLVVLIVTIVAVIMAFTIYKRNK
jgi:hypothetical protein